MSQGGMSIMRRSGAFRGHRTKRFGRERDGRALESAEETEDQDERIAQHVDPDRFQVDGRGEAAGGGRKGGLKLDASAHDKGLLPWESGAVRDSGVSRS